MEGLLTCVIAGITFLLLVNLPSNAHKAWKFLTENEAAFMAGRVSKDCQDRDEQERFQLKQFLSSGLDLKIWAFGFIYL